MAMTEAKPDAVIPIARLDHFVMPCRDVDIIADFYVRVLGATKVTFGEGRIAIQLGSQKVNLQPSGRFEGLCAPNHLPGTQDFCVITEMPLGKVKAALEAQGIEIIEGPVASVDCSARSISATRTATWSRSATRPSQDQDRAGRLL